MLSPPPTRVTPIRTMLVIDAATVGLGAAAIWKTVESALVSGPILVVLAVITLVRAIARRHAWAIGVASAHLLVCGLFFGLVNLFHWGPHDAVWPFRWMSLGYAAVIVWPTFRAIRHVLPRDRPTDHCEQCGYMLRGLIEPRCPECGRPFDRGLLVQHQSSVTADVR